MISPWKRANIQRSFDSDPNYTRCAKECHVDPKTVHQYTDKMSLQSVQRNACTVLCRYVERNPLRANLVTKAEAGRYGSLYRWNQPTEPLPRILSPWPIPRLPNWNQHVHEPISEKELSALRTCVNRGRPYGDDQWTEKMADKHGVWATLRPVGRPRKK